MIQRNINVDFSRSAGRLKPVNSVNLGPRFGMELSVDFSAEYATMGVPLVRVHNPEPPSGGGRYIDLHNIFPDPALDERFAESYNFAPTDAYLSAVKESGAEIFLRIGESGEPYEVRRHTYPPRDPEKWARIAERVIAHYNRGWANGFKWGIKYVELMPDADEPYGWGGTPTEYYEFYRTVANHIKDTFPRLKIGGYSSGGFHSLNHYDATDRERAYVSFLEGFLGYVTSPATRAPLDFLSWRCYAESPEELSLHSSYARNYLGQYGLKRTESIISEFNLSGGDGIHLSREYPASLVASLIVAAKSDVGAMFYSDLDPRSPRCGLWSLEDRTNKHYYAAYHAMCAFGTLSRKGTVVDSSEDYRHAIYSLATRDDEGGTVMIATRNYSGIIELNIVGSQYTSYSIKGLVGGGTRGEGMSTSAESIPLNDGKIRMRAGKNEVYLVTLC